MFLETTISMRLFVAALVFAAAIAPLPAAADAGHGKMHRKAERGDAQGTRDAKKMDMKEMVKSAPRLHVLHMAGEQSMRAEQISMYALLAALGIERRENLARLRQVRDTFDRVRVGLRSGDSDLGLPATTETGILVHLDTVDGAWSQLEPMLTEVLASGKVRKDHVEAFARLIPRLHTALDKMTSSYEYYAYQGRRFSALLSTFAVAESQQTRIPKMATAMLFTAYGHEVEENKKKLATTYAEFERALRGLMVGDPELRVLAAPTEEIKMGYQVVEKLWQEFQPLMENDFGPNQGDRELVAQVAQRVLPLAEQFHDAFHETVNLYHEL